MKKIVTLGLLLAFAMYAWTESGQQNTAFVPSEHGANTSPTSFVAPRIGGLKVGDSVEFFGEYESNDKGGVIHWTHHDPNGSHVEGWLKHGGRTYQ
jgi:hypothetical protein